MLISPQLETIDHDGTFRIKPKGLWKTANLEDLWNKNQSSLQLDKLSVSTSVILDGSELQAMDTSGALCIKLLLHNTPRDNIRFENFSDGHVKLIQMILGSPTISHQAKSSSFRSIVSALGLWAEQALVPVYHTTTFLGVVVLELIALPFRMRKFRINEFVVEVDRALIQAVPVIALVTFLIGVVVAYLFATQLEKYGANIMIVDSVALAMGRELSPLIVATVVAGRSGSAFTAQLGSMILTQEIDALETMGLRTLDVLIIPRVLALMFALPFLVFVGDLVSLYGGSLIASNFLDITSASFLERLSAIKPKHFISGIIKAPFFALFIALIGCRMGLNVERNARSVGLNTTSTVVQSIVAVILIDAVFAVIYMQLDY